jgi:hypothetical protein
MNGSRPPAGLALQMRLDSRYSDKPVGQRAAPHNTDIHFGPGPDCAGKRLDLKAIIWPKPEVMRQAITRQAQRQDAHADEVGTVDTFKA